MTRLTRRFVRSVVFAVLAMGFAACHFHGHGHGHGWGHYHSHFCAPVAIPRCR